MIQERSRTEDRWHSGALVRQHCKQFRFFSSCSLTPLHDILISSFDGSHAVQCWWSKPLFFLFIFIFYYYFFTAGMIQLSGISISPQFTIWFKPVFLLHGLMLIQEAVEALWSFPQGVGRMTASALIWKDPTLVFNCTYDSIKCCVISLFQHIRFYL